MKKLMLITLAFLCPISIQSSFMFKYAGEAVQLIKNNKLNTFFVAGTFPPAYSCFIENDNKLKIAEQAGQIAEQAGQIAELQQRLQENRNNSVSKTYVACFALASLCLYHGYCKIEASFQNFKKKRPSMATIFTNAQTKEEAVAELKKYWYKQQDFKTNEIPMKFSEQDMMFIHNQLA